MHGTLIHFPKQTTPATKLAASQTATIIQFPRARKRGAPNMQQIKESAGSHLPALIEDVKLDIVARWRRGVGIAYLAKMYQLTVRQVEAVIWVELYGDRRAA